MDKIYYHPNSDPMFSKPYVDIEELREKPAPHWYIHGGFEGTDLKFAYYMPTKESYGGRFFHMIAPAQCSENMSYGPNGENPSIEFAVKNGAYLVSSNMGGPASMGDMLLKCNAAAAEYSRTVARRLYGEHRPYGYACGGSGGSLKTCACIENTEGIWDGAVPFVIANPNAIPNTFTVRTHAMRLLRHKLPQIVDAMEPGGSGDPYAGLNEEEKGALEEVTKMGFPLRTWFSHDFIGDGSLLLLTPIIGMVAPTYYQDFWTVPGYLGAEAGSSAQRDRIRFETTLASIHVPEIVKIDEFNKTGVDEAWHVFDQLDKFTSVPTLDVADVPQGDLYLQGAKIKFLSGDAEGKELVLGKLEGHTITLMESFQPGVHQLLSSLKPGDKVLLDNSDYIAVQTFHRHQVPEGDVAGWRQFKNADGTPKYPQLPLAGPAMSMGGSGAVQTGHFKGKMIVVASLMDESAFPWFGDWYAKQAKEYLGAAYDDNFRIWYTDHAMHAETAGVQAKLHVVDYLGILNQALLDVAAWVEKGIAPPASTVYTEKDGQIYVPADADERGGVQPVVTLVADGSDCVKVKVGQTVHFCGTITVPNKTGKVVKAEWDFEEQGAFEEQATLEKSTDKTVASTKTTHVYSKPGIYFAVLRAESARDGEDSFTRAKNLARVRVIVE